jgi:secondary thiamine-phosphate synthase enzyme
MIKQIEISLPEFKRGYHLITKQIAEQLNELPEKGLLNLFIHHTSAGLSINENADPSVRVDLENIMNQIVPEKLPFLTHTMEGDDDMPAHVKSALIGTSLSIPVLNHKLKLGTWQGIFLCEFRNHGGKRKITATIIS